MSVSPTGIWDDETADEIHGRCQSPKLAKFLIGFFDKGKPVIDFGCGNGYYLSELEKSGFECIGIDGFPLKNHLNKNFLVHDLSEKLVVVGDNGQVTGNVMCLEVLEHLPKEFEQIALDTITSHCDGKLVLSWALPLQGGIGHINLQPQSYAISEIERRGFILNANATNDIRENIDDNADWFRRTTCIFDKI